jgi:histidinol-phosphate phosphatase family protein
VSAIESPLDRPSAASDRTVPAALLCDRDGTLLEDVPYNSDPSRVRPIDGVVEALDRARAAGLRLAVVTNQSGVAKGLITEEQLDAVHHRMTELLGPIDVIVACTHDDRDGCGCRKPRPGLVERASQLLGVRPDECVMIGDTGADVQAALGAGALGVLVPNERTLPIELRGVRHIHGDFASAVDEVIAWRRAR